MAEHDLWAAALDWQAFLEEATAGMHRVEEARALREELRAHLEQARQALLARGLSPAAAAREALAGMGDAGTVRAALAGGSAPWRAPSAPWRAGLARLAGAVVRHRTGLVAIAAGVVIAGLGSALGTARQQLATDAHALQQAQSTVQEHSTATMPPVPAPPPPTVASAAARAAMLQREADAAQIRSLQSQVDRQAADLNDRAMAQHVADESEFQTVAAALRAMQSRTSATVAGGG